MISKKNMQSDLNDATNLLAMLISSDVNDSIRRDAILFVTERGYRANNDGNYSPTAVLDSDKISRSESLNEASKLVYRAMAKLTVNSSGMDLLESVSRKLRAMFSDFDNNAPTSVRVTSDDLSHGITVYVIGDNSPTFETVTRP